MTDYYVEDGELWEVVARDIFHNAGLGGSLIAEAALENVRTHQRRLALPGELAAMTPVVRHATVKPELSQEVNT